MLSGTIAHFSHIVVQESGSFTAKVEADQPRFEIGSPLRAAASVRKSTSTESGYLSQPAFISLSPIRRDLLVTDPQGENPEFKPNTASFYRMYLHGECTASGIGSLIFNADMRGEILGDYGLELLFTIELVATVECVPAAPPPGSVVSVGLFNIPGLTAPDGINYFAGPFGSLTVAGPYAAIAGAEGMKVLDLVTRQVVLDRTSIGPDGATLGTNLLGAVPVAQSASAGARSAMIGFANDGAFVQNWNATASWGGTSRDAQPTFDVVTAGGGLVANTVALVRPVFGIDIVSFDAAAMAYRSDPARFAPLTAFPGGGQLVSAQMPDGASGGVLVLSRATSASISTSSKVFYKNIDDALPAVTLLSMGNVDSWRLRCIPVGTRQACVATLFGGEGRAFLFDPASPRDTPRVTTLAAAAGTLGVALALLPNGRVGVVMANFTANSLTVAELSADLVTLHSSNTIPAPSGCMGTAHSALLADSEGLKAIVTCNGTNNYWVVKPFP